MNKSLQIEAQAFSARKSLEQASVLRDLVQRNESWLWESEYAGAVARYNRPQVKAALQIARVATASSIVHPYILRARTAEDPASSQHHDPETKRWQAIGIGTLVRGQVVCTGEHHYMATDMDYWLDDEAQERISGLHREVAETLLTAATRQVYRHEGRKTSQAIATIVPGADHQPTGFAEIMHRPVNIEPLTVIGDDPYDIAKGGINLATYTLPLEFWT